MTAMCRWSGRQDNAPSALSFRFLFFMGTLLAGKTGKRSESVAPHRIDMIAQFGQTFRVEAEVVPGPPALFFQQARGLQNLQVLRYRWSAYRNLRGKLSHGPGFAP